MNLIIGITLFNVLLSAKSVLSSGETDKRAAEIIKQSHQTMENGLILGHKVTDLKKKARSVMLEPKREAILNIAKGLNRIAKDQKRIAVEEAKEALSVSPLMAAKGLQVLKKQGTQLNKSSARLLSQKILPVKKSTKKSKKQCQLDPED